MPEIIDPVFAKTSQNARFLLSENERIGLVFVKTGSINSATGIIGAVNLPGHEVGCRVGVQGWERTSGYQPAQGRRPLSCQLIQLLLRPCTAKRIGSDVERLD